MQRSKSQTKIQILYFQLQIEETFWTLLCHFDIRILMFKFVKQGVGNALENLWSRLQHHILS